jgi:hypothetical protein
MPEQEEQKAPRGAWPIMRSPPSADEKTDADASSSKMI